MREGRAGRRNRGGDTWANERAAPRSSSLLGCLSFLSLKRGLRNCLCCLRVVGRQGWSTACQLACRAGSCFFTCDVVCDADADAGANRARSCALPEGGGVGRRFGSAVDFSNLSGAAPPTLSSIRETFPVHILILDRPTRRAQRGGEPPKKKDGRTTKNPPSSHASARSSGLARSFSIPLDRH
jgi:hypothetical protein